MSNVQIKIHPAAIEGLKSGFKIIGALVAVALTALFLVWLATLNIALTVGILFIIFLGGILLISISDAMDSHNVFKPGPYLGKEKAFTFVRKEDEDE